MRFKTRARTSIRMGGAVFVGASLVAAVAASSISTAAASVPTVKISVASLIPGSTAAATAAFNSQVQQFEKANPGIKVTSVQYQWLGTTFAAKLAAGTLPTVFTVPFTDGRALGDNGQLANLTKYAKALPYFNKFNPAVIAEGIDAKGQVIAIPTASYAQALSYNRHLFSEAGLNPNDPPTTWAQLEADAKQISEKTGMAGYAEMGANDNTAGWILTTLDYALGGRMETGIGSKAKATFDNPQAVQALKMLNTMRWQDNSMGSDFDWGWSDINQAFAAGQVGMFISGSDVYTNMVQSYNINPTIYGLAPIPLANNKNAGVLGGGTLAAVSPNADTGAGCGGGEMDRLLLPPAVREPAAGDPLFQDAGRQRAAGRHAGGPDLQPEAGEPLRQMDLALRQRPAQPNGALHHGHLQRPDNPRAGGGHPGRVRRP